MEHARKPALPVMPDAARLALCVFGCLAVGALGGIATAEGVSGWYSTLRKPPFNPPNFVFGPVWTLLYLLMGVALWRVLRSAKRNGDARPLWLFGGQLLLNAIWSPLFFSMQAPGLALVDLVALWGVLLATLLAFRKVDAPAAWMLVPYLAWVSFAGLLNASIWWLNR